MQQRPPAYGQRLLAKRRGRQLVLRVHLVVGADWTPPALGPLDAFLALGPARWRAGATDWRCVTDLLVIVHDRTDQWPGLWHVIGEVSDFAAMVELAGEPADFTAKMMRLDSPGRHWPAWWSDSRQVIHEQRWRRFERAVTALRAHL